MKNEDELREFIDESFPIGEGNFSPELVIFIAQKRKTFLENCLKEDWFPGIGITIVDGPDRGIDKLSKASLEKLKDYVRKLIREDIEQMEKYLPEEENGNN